MNDPAPQDTTRVIKKIDPKAAGARRWAATYGEKSVCVRNRLDPQATEPAVAENVALPI